MRNRYSKSGFMGGAIIGAGGIYPPTFLSDGGLESAIDKKWGVQKLLIFKPILSIALLKFFSFASLAIFFYYYKLFLFWYKESHH